MLSCAHRYVADLNCVVAGSLDKLVSITDAEERVPLKVLDGHTKGVTSVDWSSMYKFVCRCVPQAAENIEL